METENARPIPGVFMSAAIRDTCFDRPADVDLAALTVLGIGPEIVLSASEAPKRRLKEMVADIVLRCE